MKSILPEELHDEIPVGFNTAGHVGRSRTHSFLAAVSDGNQAHLNLREQYLPYKSVIAQVLLDKVPQVKTVINKTDNVGTESVFRTFSYEVLAGPNDLNVEVKENDCTFRFDYSKVYWNSKLDTEHSRLVDMFQPGEVVCDVMAGIGPFAVPAGKKGVFVWANDMNPDSYLYLQQAIVTNKVLHGIQPWRMLLLTQVTRSKNLSSHSTRTASTSFRGPHAWSMKPQQVAEAPRSVRKPGKPLRIPGEQR